MSTAIKTDMNETLDVVGKIMTEAGMDTKINADDFFEGKFRIIIRKLYQKHGKLNGRTSRVVWKEFVKEEKALLSRIRGTAKSRTNDTISLKSFCKYYNAVTSMIEEELNLETTKVEVQ